MLKNIVLFSIVLLMSGCFEQTPKCSEKEVVDVLTKVLSNDSRTAKVNPDFIVELSQNKENGIRSCSAKNVEFSYKIDKNNEFISSVKKGFMDAAPELRKSTVEYDVMLNDNKDKFIVEVKKL